MPCEKCISRAALIDFQSSEASLSNQTRNTLSAEVFPQPVSANEALEIAVLACAALYFGLASFMEAANLNLSYPMIAQTLVVVASFFSPSKCSASSQRYGDGCSLY
jgi:hypothetical protein